MKAIVKIGWFLIALVFFLTSCHKCEDVLPEDSAYEKSIREDQRPTDVEIRDFEEGLPDDGINEDDAGGEITDDDDDEDDDGITDDDDDDDDDDDSKKSSN